MSWHNCVSDVLAQDRQGTGREPRAQIEGAMNDLRNQAAGLGANYIQNDPPLIARRRTAAVSGTAYRCTAEPMLR
jgi:hypothetical protein